MKKYFGKLISLIKYLWRAWPIIIIMFLIALHVHIVFFFPLQKLEINKIIALISQLLGGLIVLYSIDSNIGILKKKNLFKIFASYLKEFPLIRRKVVVNVGCQMIAITAMKAKIEVTRKPKTIDERMDYLQEQIDVLRKENETESKELQKKIDKRFNRVDEKLSESQKSIKSVESKIEDVSIGGIKLQLFGVILMIYGAFSGYLA